MQSFEFKIRTDEPLCEATKEVLMEGNYVFNERQEDGHTIFQWMFLYPGEIWELGIKAALRVIAAGKKLTIL